MLGLSRRRVPRVMIWQAFNKGNHRVVCGKFGTHYGPTDGVGARRRRGFAGLRKMRCRNRGIHNL
jgi:hypothetical protein